MYDKEHKKIKENRKTQNKQIKNFLKTQTTVASTVGEQVLELA